MAWHAQLKLDYQLESGRSVLRHVHTGPLRILQSLYPEGDSVCHNVLVHPPGGLVGGDTLDINVHLGPGAHGLLTTPGATRFYRSEGATARQTTQVHLEKGSRLEWLPLEALCYSGCLAENYLTIHLDPGAELMGWDVTALGLPHANQPFTQGSFLQHLEVPGLWLERGVIDSGDMRLLASPVGLAGYNCIATVFLVAGSHLARERRERALAVARSAVDGHALAGTTGFTSPHPQVVVGRVLSPVVEPAMAMLRRIRTAWRSALWDLQPTEPRVWAM